MNKLRNYIPGIVLWTFLALSPVYQTGCALSTSQQNIAVQTLKAVGQTADAAVALSAQLYQAGTITGDQAREILDFYNQTFQPAFVLASASVMDNTGAMAPQHIVDLAAQLSALVTKYQHH